METKWSCCMLTFAWKSEILNQVVFSLKETHLRIIYFWALELFGVLLDPFQDCVCSITLSRKRIFQLRNVDLLWLKRWFSVIQTLCLFKLEMGWLRSHYLFDWWNVCRWHHDLVCLNLMEFLCRFRSHILHFFINFSLSPISEMHYFENPFFFPLVIVNVFTAILLLQALN